jgi:HEAT repeat protein
LVPLLRDPDVSVRVAAAVALCSLGPAAAPALPELVALLRDPDVSVRVDRALGRRGLRVPAAPADPDLLRDPNSDVRATSEVLGSLDLSGPGHGETSSERGPDPTM